MRIDVIGGGPAGLYFSILMKKHNPRHEITVFERNRADDTFGWGVVFSAETLGHFEEADAESYRKITANFRYWDDIDTWFKGECVKSTGHGFAGMERKLLLQLLHERCESLGVVLKFQHDVTDLAPHLSADLVVASDGINSMVREKYAEHFRPTMDWRKCKFTWLGTDLPLTAFTFWYKENEHGLFQVHAYPFKDRLSTFIVECREEVWKKAGLDKASEADTVAYCEKLFREELRGHRLLTNRSLWRTFPTIRCEKWSHQNIVLMGDAVHTAHFSIGSGTKLAMEDAIALRDAFVTTACPEKPTRAEVESVLAFYHETRWLDVAKLQRAAQVSLEFFENTARYLKQDPVQFTFNQTTRSKRITWDNLAKRDPLYVMNIREWFARQAGADRASDGSWPVPMFTPYKLRGMDLVNRVVVSPMCMYSAEDGTVGDWHLVHLGSRAVGGAGLVVCEGTAVSRDGRISLGCAGMYLDSHVPAWQRVTDFVHTHSKARIALQLCHSGRKGSTRLPWQDDGRGDTHSLAASDGGWETIAPSAIGYNDRMSVPRAMTRADMDRVRGDFVDAARRAEAAGFDMVELHFAHGYLLGTFISPLTNLRTDEYGGDIAGRMRFPLEVFSAVRGVWPSHKPISVRISAVDWAGGGQTADMSVEVARMLKAAGCDIIDVSAGQTVAHQEPVYGRMFQVPFSDQIRHEAQIPTMTVGNLQGPDHVNTVLASGRADLCVMARPHLRDPYLTLHAAETYGFPDQFWPNPYLAVKPVRRRVEAEELL